MRSVDLSIPKSTRLTLGRLESISFDKPGVVTYNFLGGPVLSQLHPSKLRWKNFIIEKELALNNAHHSTHYLPIQTGDIVQFNPQGLSVVIFENSSYSNAFLLTERCNSKCIMCPQPPQKSGDHTHVCIATADLIQGELTSIGITGGEPTVNWQGLIQLLTLLGQRHPNATVDLLTNARVLHYAYKAKELAQATKNRLIACIPLYSDIADIHDRIVGSENAFWETIEGIYNLERLKIAVELRIVVINQNYSRLNKWAEFVCKHFPFLKHIAIMGLEPTGKARENIDQVWIDPVNYSDQLVSAIRTLRRAGMKYSIYNHQLCTIPKILWQYTKKSISEWKNYYFFHCSDCSAIELCGGLFQSSGVKHSRGLKPISF